MSHIFDALQRAEAERGGKTRNGSQTATDLLERAERQAASQWTAEAGVQLADEPDFAASERLFGAGSAGTESASVGAGPSAGIAGIFQQFRKLEVSVSAANRLVSLTDPEAAAAEAFRLFAVRLRDLRASRPLNKLLITSTTPQEGKSLISANLACTLAAGGQQRVVLVEGDLRRPSLGEKFGLKEPPGLTEWLRNGTDPAATIYHLEGAGCWMVPAGQPTGNPLELLQSKKLPPLIEQLTAWFDWVIIDSPPVMPLADTSVWARIADGILLVTRSGVTEKRQLERGLEALDQQKLIGAILNSSKESHVKDYYYYQTSAAETRAAKKVAAAVSDNN